MTFQVSPRSAQDSQQPLQSPLRAKLLQLYDLLSNKIAGGQRVDHQSLLPGVDDPLEGTIPEDFSTQLAGLDWFTPGDWAGLAPEDTLRINMSAITKPSGPPIEGNGMDFYRSGEAPDNFTNRNNPLYIARKDFIAQIAPKINEMFGTTAGGVNYYRPPSSSDADPGGRSSNSDHYSAGAADFFGTPEQLDSLRNWMIEQPWISFVRWRSESHGGETGTESGAHLHASFDLGWIASNYFSGRTTPTIKPPAPTAPTMTLQPEPATPTPSPSPSAPSREGMS